MEFFLLVGGVLLECDHQSQEIPVLLFFTSAPKAVISIHTKLFLVSGIFFKLLCTC